MTERKGGTPRPDRQRGRDAPITLEKWRWSEESEGAKVKEKETGISTDNE